MRSRVLRGFAWKAGSHVVLLVARVASTVVLARHLTPHDYGVVGMALVFVTPGLVLADVALGTALVQRRFLREVDALTVFWTSIVAGLILSLAGIALSEPVSRFYGEPEVRPLLAALSATFALASVAATHRAILSRQLEFGKLEAINVLAGITAGAAAVWTALEGHGAWALVVYQLAGAAVSTALVWVMLPWRPRWGFSFASLGELSRVGGDIVGARALFSLHRNVDNFLVGRFLGAAALGAYAFAYSLMLLPLSQLTRPVQTVLFPALARLHDDPRRVASLWLRVTRFMAAICVPATLGLVVFAPELVSVVFGDRWERAVPVIRVLAIVGLLQCLTTLNAQILVAMGRTRALLRFSAVTFGVSMVGFVVGLPWGIVGVASGYLVANLVLVPLYFRLTAMHVGISAGRLARNLRGVAEASLGMLALIVVSKWLLLVGNVAAGPRLAILVLAGAGTFLPFCRWRAPQVFGEVSRLRRVGRPSAV
ncbi:MAG: lipopolysaccharide biosynthesis protein [Gaiellaceae bacterium]